MSGGFKFDLSAIAFSRRLVISTFAISYLRSLWPHCLRLEMLFKVWQGNLRKLITAENPESGKFTDFHTHTE